MTGDPRPSWDEWGLNLAAAVATRADCTRRQVGAVLLDREYRVVATGYNGAPSGARGCLTGDGCPRGQTSYDEVPSGSSYDRDAGACIAIHAEQNVIIRSSPSQMSGATLYVTHEPCYMCSRLIKGTPILRAVWPGGNLLNR